MKKLPFKLTIILLMGLFFGLIVNSKEVPKPVSSVIDPEKILNENEQTKISRAFDSYKNQTGNDIRIFLAKSLDGEKITSYTEDVAKKWRLNTREKQSILFFLSLKEREMRLIVSPKLESRLTGQKRREIIGKLAPFFKEKDYTAGLIHLGQSLDKHLTDGNFDFNSAMNTDNSSWWPFSLSIPSLTKHHFYPLGGALVFICFIALSGRRFFPRRSYIGKRRYHGPKNGGTSGSW